MKEKGKLIKILKPESGVSKSGKEWKRREFVIETDEKYPRKLCFTLFGDKMLLLDDVYIDQEVEVEFTVESQEYKDKWFHKLNAYKVYGLSNAATKPDYGFANPEGVYNGPLNTNDEDDDLPF